jgi:tRNA modification GTPase
MTDTIFAVSSGRPPAAIAIVRVSGPQAMTAATRLAGTVPAPRRATLRALRDSTGLLLDRALLLAFPGPDSATGEDLLEIHAHGGSAVVAAIEHALEALPGLRRAEPGEFTRRALENGRLDLSQAEGLADLLAAETEEQRRQAILASEGDLSRAVSAWMERLSSIAAMIEVAIDYDDEEDAGDPQPAAIALIEAVRGEILQALSRPPVERLHDGIRVVLAGPPNSGKSTLFNALVEREAAITSPIAGTTRDLVESIVLRGGQAYVLIDTAGLAEMTDDPIEAIGIDRAGKAVATADILLWLGDDAAPEHPAVILIHPRADLPDRSDAAHGRLRIAKEDVAGLNILWSAIENRGIAVIPRGNILFNQRQRAALQSAATALMLPEDDLLLLSEQLRVATAALADTIGIDATEAMLDQLFTRFCLGK